MISPKASPLSPDKVQKLQAWLSDPARHIFQQFVADRASLHTALAGNALNLIDPLNEEDQYRIEAKNESDVARQFIAVNKVIDECMQDDFKFEAIELNPDIKPL